MTVQDGRDMEQRGAAPDGRRSRALRGLIGGIARFRRDRDGATAVEFAIVSAVFLAMIASIVEFAMMYATSAMLEQAVFQAGRMIRTGRAQQAVFDVTANQLVVPPNTVPTGHTTRSPTASELSAWYTQTLCSNLYALVRCDSNLHLDVQSASSVAGLSTTVPYNSLTHTWTTQYSPGTAQQIVLVRVFYDYHSLIPGMLRLLNNMTGNARRFQASTAFRTEPYQ